MQACRGCKNKDLEKVVSLGKTPLANNFLLESQLNLPEKFYPLELYFCRECGLVQMGYVVPADEMYTNYLYVPSASETFIRHFSEMAVQIKERFSLSSDDLVVDIGGNDGTLLKNFKKMGIKTLNIEPAKNIAKMAEDSGIETIVDYFSEKTAESIVEEKGKAKVIIATNVFTHVDNLDDLLNGVSILLADDGVFVIEVYYLGSIVRNISFDIIYHEHLSYFTVHSLSKLFERFGMKIFDVETTSMHGGSLRVFVCKSKYEKSDSVDEILSVEKEMGLDNIESYANFAKMIGEIKNKLIGLLKNLKADGKRIVGYGAPAKSTTLLNYFGIGKDYLYYIVDRSGLKQNRYTPGTHIPILSPETLLEDMPDYVLILAWNVADEIINQEKKYKEMGGKFIIPIPVPRIVE